MNKQINLRLPTNMLKSAEKYSEKHGYSTLQEFIKETIREKLYENSGITEKELALVKKLILASKEKKLYKTEKELFKKLKVK